MKDCIFFLRGFVFRYLLLSYLFFAEDQFAEKLITSGVSYTWGQAWLNSFLDRFLLTRKIDAFILFGIINFCDLSNSPRMRFFCSYLSFIRVFLSDRLELLIFFFVEKVQRSFPSFRLIIQAFNNEDSSAENSGKSFYCIVRYTSSLPVRSFTNFYDIPGDVSVCVCAFRVGVALGRVSLAIIILILTLCYMATVCISESNKAVGDQYVNIPTSLWASQWYSFQAIAYFTLYIHTPSATRV